MRRRVWLGLLLAFSVSCAYQPLPTAYGFPGFFSGMFHGFILPWSFAGSLFSDTMRIYAFPNSGTSYDFGYVIGLFFLGAAIFEAEGWRETAANGDNDDGDEDEE